MLYGTSVILREMTAGDLVYLAKFSQEPEVAALTGGRFFAGSEQTPQELNITSRSRRRWAILTLEQELIGEIELDHILWQRHEAELAICIVRKEYWSRGFGTDAVRTLLCHAFADLKLASVYLRVYHHNIRAIRAYEHCGFRKVGSIQLDNHGQAQQVVLMVVNNQGIELSAQRQWHMAAPPQKEPAV